MKRYKGRFAPSPTGPLHAGSLVAALASWLDARAHGGQWLVRMEDVDTTRCLANIDQTILQQLSICGLHSDQPVMFQAPRDAVYQSALDQLIAMDAAYPCACSRKDITQALQLSGHDTSRHSELVYPGTCRSGLQGRPARAWRMHTETCIKNQAVAQTSPGLPATYSIANDAFTHTVDLPGPTTHGQPSPSPVSWTDRRLGRQRQDVATAVGDFVLKRADGCHAYQLAVVVDDAAQGITDVVRGEDLADNTARQILLQRALGLPTPRYLHTPLVLGADGHKLSKQNGAQALALNDSQHDPLAALGQAAAVLGLAAAAGSVTDALALWTAQWRAVWL